MNYVLFLYSVVSVATYSSHDMIAQEWKPIAVFSGTEDNKKLCEDAAKQLVVVSRTRCINVGKGGM